jgi:hypothetical protein
VKVVKAIKMKAEKMEVERTGLAGVMELTRVMEMSVCWDGEGIVRC